MRRRARVAWVFAVCALPLLVSCSLVTSYDGLMGPGGDGEPDAQKIVGGDARVTGDDSGSGEDTTTGGGGDAGVPVGDSGGSGSDSDTGLGSGGEGGSGTESGPATESGVDAPGTANTFPGDYTCTATTTVMVTAPISTSAQENLSGTLKLTQTGTTLSTSLSIPTGSIQTMCTLTFSVSGTTATLSPANQTCMAQITSPFAIAATIDFLAGGDATISGVTLTSTLPYTLSGSTPYGQGQGHGTLSSTCTK